MDIILQVLELCKLVDLNLTLRGRKLMEQEVGVLKQRVSVGVGVNSAKQVSLRNVPPRYRTTANGIHHDCSQCLEI